jgi:hypothetical protein
MILFRAEPPPVDAWLTVEKSELVPTAAAADAADAVESDAVDASFSIR